ncbi:MAG: bifunctional diaminohydroxyphosphoribosylaminopyrimidine deaminase/5-amino-6-(5-phosphoribosylamino)uracil reductase RibD, partial [Deferrisomatales bacterium]|nr:bifunctional diaminohydroxyphosphoribosylaminopyrimidine deaminase/5-amino-6-(5-phosphoribosylamino)uracil reductase RibD [Deferrisomatales bacterium]
ILGRGFHPAAGQPHAEVLALREAGALAHGADVYVTLEPCSHHGRTPPCAGALVEARPQRVVVATVDPNPQVAGRGIRALRDAGIPVEVGVGEREARRLNEAFALSVTARRSFVHLKLAATLDGRIATAAGDSRWITSAESRQRVHRLRQLCGAVVVGVGTAAADDPRLTVRLPGAEEQWVTRVVLDPALRIPPGGHLLDPDSARHTLLACGERAAAERGDRYRGLGCQVLPLPGPPGRLDLGALLAELHRRGRMEVLVEGGAETAQRFLADGLVDRVHLFYAPKLLGGRGSLGMLGGADPERIADALELAELEVERVGPDLYVTGKPVNSEEGTVNGNCIP